MYFFGTSEQQNILQIRTLLLLVLCIESPNPPDRANAKMLKTNQKIIVNYLLKIIWTLQNRKKKWMG
jgi:hypothetical protein